MPRVSVVIPTQNRAHRVGAAIASVLRQTFPEFRIVVVDDGSEDNTETVVRAIADDRLLYVRHDGPRGDGAARNTGIRSSGGDLIAFLDDDDEWLPEKLELQVAEFDRSEATGLIHTAYYVISPGGSTEVFRTTEDSITQLRQARIATSTVMVRRPAVEAVGLFDESIPFCSDYDLWLRLARIYPIQYLDIPLARYLAFGQRLSNNLHKVIEGKHMLFAKHTSFLEEDPESYSDHCVALGFVCCCADQMRRGRAAFRNAIRLRPTALEAYVHYAVSLGGAKVFRALETLPRRCGLKWGPEALEPLL
jgi:glycosyltransferase involved in cell wall biosynthesis